ncbi:uncharacterized protein [Macrobrachium rosenbergii]|uniref:uncharacterized protein isoform X2 n=1 Tax=Macrobrachium rosenbergii TaxID=79674 RepID=UPI0034D6B693
MEMHDIFLLIFVSICGLFLLAYSGYSCHKYFSKELLLDSRNERRRRLRNILNFDSARAFKAFSHHVPPGYDTFHENELSTIPVEEVLCLAEEHAKYHKSTKDRTSRTSRALFLTPARNLPAVHKESIANDNSLTLLTTPSDGHLSYGTMNSPSSFTLNYDDPFPSSDASSGTSGSTTTTYNHPLANHCHSFCISYDPFTSVGNDSRFSASHDEGFSSSLEETLTPNEGNGHASSTITSRD